MDGYTDIFISLFHSINGFLSSYTHTQTGHLLYFTFNSILSKKFHWSLQENNRTEIERLDRERKADFKNMLKGFVLNQVKALFICPLILLLLNEVY